VSGRAFAVLALAVLAVSFGAPLSRLVEAAGLAVAGWRMVLATAILLPVAATRHGLRLEPRHRGPALLAGVALGFHFGLWIPSLWLTSVSASVVLVSTAPLFVLLASPRFLGAAIRPRNVASCLLALVGVVVITRGDVRLSLAALAGDLMALGGALCMAVYLVVGKRLRGELPLARYLAVVYGLAAATIVAGVAVLRVEPLPRTGVSWLFLLGLAVVPTLTGHSLLNWSLGHLPAYQVNLALLFEPVLATLWAWLVLAEAPPLHVLPGAALVIAALAIEFLGGRDG
jgi:drug/metabolite transporter (DMT)-like permease